MQNYNWFSANNPKRYNHAYEPEPRLTQYSDEGRHKLGSYADPESVELRENIIKAMSEESLKKWVDFQEEMREKCSMNKQVLKLKGEKIDERLRSYPKKQYGTDDEFDEEIPDGSDSSQPSRIDYDRSKYVLNRKNNVVLTIASTVPTSSAAESSSSDQIFVDDSKPSTTRTRWVISEKEGNGEMRVSSSANGHQLIRASVSSTADKSPKKNGRIENGSTLIVTVPTKSSVVECVLNKYGHCFAPSICPFAHNGIVRKNKGKIKETPSWQRKLPDTTLCSGYLNLQCWDPNCENRHTVYPSDAV